MLSENADKRESGYIGGQGCVSDVEVTQVHQLQNIFCAFKYLLADRMCQPNRVFKIIPNKFILLPIEQIPP